MTQKLFCMQLILCMIASTSLSLATDRVITGSAGSVLSVQQHTQFNQPWAMTFLPNGDLLVTEKAGQLIWLQMKDQSKQVLKGVPDVAYGGQGGLGDIVLDPDYTNNHWLYISYVEQDQAGNKGAIVARAQWYPEDGKLSLENLHILWRQSPKVSGSGHYSHRLAFAPDGHLFITSGDRQKMIPAQSWQENLGKIIRINADGSIPVDNPFQDKGELAKSFWTLGHRNMLGIAFDQQGRLWVHEMGPHHGDELNLIIAGKNYGWPIVSEGNHYSGIPIPNHKTRPDFEAPSVFWVPTIAPSGLIVYSGNLFPAWQTQVLIGGLKSESLIRVGIDDDTAKEIERFDLGQRIREVEQAADGSIWLLEDQANARLLQLTPNATQLSP